MGALRNNRLLIVSVVVVAFYWLIGPALPSPYLAGVLSLLLLIAGTLTLAQYIAPTYEILFHQKRSEDERGRGSHLAIYGIFLFSFGSVWAGGFGVLWNMAGQPPDWLGTAMSNFGRLCHIAGFFLMQVSPDVTKEGIELRGRWWLVTIGSIVLVGIGFWLGVQLRTFEASYAWRELHVGAVDRPACPDDRAVWGSSSKVYHTQDSPYRAQIIPVRCFATKEEAERAGFKPPTAPPIALPPSSAAIGG
jgi:hypothetical protein